VTATQKHVPVVAASNPWRQPSRNGAQQEGDSMKKLYSGFLSLVVIVLATCLAGKAEAQATHQTIIVGQA
jgi:hypothetical protein